jgi:purine-binding chemotaxis protein CheW
MTDQTSHIEWAKIYERLERARASLAQGGVMSAERQRQLLKARARELARPLRPDAPPENVLEVIEFRLAEARYAVETQWVREVWPLRELTPVPCTPPFVRGVINVRGRILSVLDLRRFFALPPGGLSDLNKVIILRKAALEFGILADRVLSVRQLPGAELHSVAPALAGLRAEYLHGVTSDAVIVLAVNQLLADPRLIVREEV